MFSHCWFPIVSEPYFCGKDNLDNNSGGRRCEWDDIYSSLSREKAAVCRRWELAGCHTVTVTCEVTSQLRQESGVRSRDLRMENTEINVEKLAAEMAGNTLMDETSVNDQTYQQIVAFLKTEKMNIFR